MFKNIKLFLLWEFLNLQLGLDDRVELQVQPMNDCKSQLVTMIPRCGKIFERTQSVTHLFSYVLIYLHSSGLEKWA